MIQREMRPCKVSQLGITEPKDAHFHGWGIDFMETEMSPWAMFTVGIVEMADGKVKKVDPTLITFTDKGPG